MADPILLCDTAGMDNDRWLECRAHGPKGDIEYTVGGSDVATIFGLSPWMTPLELWLIKKGPSQPTGKAKRLVTRSSMTPASISTPITLMPLPISTGAPYDRTGKRVSWSVNLPAIIRPKIGQRAVFRFITSSNFDTT